MLPTTKSDQFAPVLALIAEGKTMKAACEECGIEPRDLYRARKADPDLDRDYATAQELGAEISADSLHDIHHEIANPLLARVVSENRRWLLARRFAQRYGDRLAIDDGGRTDLTDILREAIARIPRPTSDQSKAIEGETVTIADIFGNGTADT